MKVRKNRILLYSWLPTVSCHKTLAMWNFFSWKSGEHGPFYPMKDHLYRSKSYFSGRNLEKILPVNETLNCFPKLTFELITMCLMSQFLWMWDLQCHINVTKN